MKQILQTLIYDGMVRSTCLYFIMMHRLESDEQCCRPDVHLCLICPQIDEQENENGEVVYVNLIMQMPSTSPLSSIPCGQCPVIGECAEGNDVSPSTCEYMTEWLEF